MNICIYDLETDSSKTDFLSILEFGAILLNDNFQELDRINLRCRIPEGVIPQASALLINGISVKMLTQGNLSHYQMIGEIEKVFQKWTPAIFIGYSNINFDDEAIRKEFFKGLRYPYITNTGLNKRHDALNIVRAAYAVDNKIFKTETNNKGNAIMKLESLARTNGIKTDGAHSALFDANLTKLILEKIYREQNITWRSALMTTSRNETESLLKKEKMFTLNEYFYGKSRLFLCCPLHPDFSIHPVYNWSLAFDLKNDVKPLLNLPVSELKVELKKSPKFVRTIRSNKAPIILHANYGMKVEPYNIINPKLLKERAELILKNRAFAEKISTILREDAEEKQATSSQEDITAEQSIYKKFTSNSDNVLMPQWHEASWEEKFKLLHKFEDERLVDFGKKIIYQNSDVLPESEHKKVKRAIAERILSEKKEKWWTVKEFYNECDYHRVKFEEKNDLQKLEFLNELNNYVEGVERKYSNA